MTILDRLLKSSVDRDRLHFRPTDADEVFALRLAQKLGDEAAAAHYVDLQQEYSQSQLLIAHRRVVASGARRELARSFHVELRQLQSRNGLSVQRHRLAAIRIERRGIAVAILKGEQLEYLDVRQLSSGDQALNGAARFMNRMLEKFPFESAALETLPPTGQVQRTLLNDIIVDLLRQHDVSLWQISKHEVFDGFGQPPLRSRKELREVITRIWPSLNGGYGAPLMKDAVALGLHCQIERLFNT